MPVNHLTFSNIIISADKGVQATNASDITFNNVVIKTPSDPVYNLNNTKNFTINNIGTEKNKTFISANGKSSNIIVTGKNAQAVKNSIQLNDGIAAGEVTVK